MAERALITYERLHELLDYEPGTGIFRRKVGRGNQVRGDLAARKVSFTGYKRIRIDGHEYRAHRLAWLWVHGKWPMGELDHVNGDRANNRISNLREATSTQNKHNSQRYKNNRSGYKGVCWNANLRKFQAQISVDGKTKHLGLFRSAPLAHIVYMCHAVLEFGTFARLD